MYEGFLREVKATKALRTTENTEQALKEFDVYPCNKTGLLKYIEDEKAKGIKDSTLTVKLTVLRRYFTWLMYNGEDSDKLTEMIRLTKEIKGDTTLQSYATREQVNEILAAARGVQKKLIIALCYFAGLRISEALSLQWRDIKERSFIVRNTKTKTDREVPVLSPILADLLKRYRETKQGTLLFDGVSQNTMQVYLKRLVTRLGYPDLHFHSLRSGFVTAAFEKNIDTETIMTITGHKQMANVQRYAHCTPAMMERAKGIFE